MSEDVPPIPTWEEVRVEQLRAIHEVEDQLERGELRIDVEGRSISREAAWAATQALRKAFATDDGRYDGQQRDENGEWFARVEVAGELRLFSIGVFPG